ncbi:MULTISPECIES: TetR family transcriptional regulator [unclassified Crossiella]|uniref:TetR/AcrR family transcriptional regulator n=1 Tax=unclassified Crossiella TaxID=2620835 RepID=UPI001FFE79BD|nr:MULTISPECIES: TetR family transcriptional regulator [unclassified Crossiella]MCK2237963.1 TetR family transcriptional regulator [Crossiella sp. S99.2]MCK2255246.1 TetR family transcriptional regulator [Crossiella sp. S99.1]
MAQITPFSARVKASLRETLLDAAANLLAEGGYQGLRMAEVATAAGVSRQTVYNEFGNKDALVQAVALRLTAQFLAGTAERLDREENLLDGIRAATGYILSHATANRLIGAMLTGADAQDMLPFLTTRGAPVLTSAAELVCQHTRARLPRLPAALAELYAETAVRLTVSHLLLPSGEPGHAAEAVATVAGAMLGPYLSTKE